MEETMGKHSEDDLFAEQGEISQPKPPARITGASLQQLFEQQGRRCALTGQQLHRPVDCAVDHIIPVSDGGANDMSNIQIVHRTVNAMKGSLSQQEFIAFCRAVASHADHMEKTKLQGNEYTEHEKKSENLLFS